MHEKNQPSLSFFQGDFIQGFSDGMTKWSIESAGQDLYRVRQ